MTTVNLGYIRILYNYLFGIPDDEIEATINLDNPVDRELFFAKAKDDFDRWGPITQKNILDALEYVLSKPDLEIHWRKIIPHDLPITISKNKRGYVHSLFFDSGKARTSRKYTI